MNIKKILLPALLVCVLMLTAIMGISCTKKPADTGNNGGSPDACAHESYQWIVDVESTCTAEGSKHKECISCKESLGTVKTAPTEHVEEIIKGNAPTCTEKGLTDGKKCAICAKILLEQKEIAATYHTEQLKAGKAPTCTEDGLTDGIFCSVCKSEIVKQTVIGKNDHNESDWIIDRVATASAAGAKHTECTACKTTIKTETIAATSASHVHEGKTRITKVYPTCKAAGESVLICDCGLEMGGTEPVSKLDHTEQKLLAIAPTCTSTGLTEGKKCTVCGDILIAQRTIAKKEHTDLALLGKAATCTATGLTDGTKCAVCTTVTKVQMIIPAKGHSFKDGSCSRCGKAEPYGIFIVDGIGNPISDVFVKIMKDGEQVKLLPYKGEFLKIDLEVGTYQVVLDISQLEENYIYDESLCVLTPEKKSTAIRLFIEPEEKREVFVGDPILKDYEAYYVSEGSNKIALTPNDYTFLIFKPKTSAIYTLTYECDTELTVSYHGSTFFVQGRDLSDDSDDLAKYENGLSLSVYPGNIGSDYVFAIRSSSATSCVLNIKNAGEPGTRLVDEPWTPYLEDEAKVREQLNMKPTGTYTTVDLLDLTLKAVLNENDGYYHLGTADGPIIFIDLTTDSEFITSIQDICALQRMGTYIYDMNGAVIEKRSYNELFYQYGMPSTSDTTPEDPIRVPLTEKIAEAIKTFGDNYSWWAIGSELNIFNKVLLGQPYNQEFAWLLFCGYYK